MRLRNILIVVLIASSFNKAMEMSKDKANFWLRDSAKTGDIEIAKQALALGARLDIKDELGNTPLHLAAMHGRSEVVSLFIQHGANIDAQNDLGSTPLHALNRDFCLPSYSGSLHNHTYLDLMEWLITHGANVSIVDKYMRKAFILSPDHQSDLATAILTYNAQAAEEILDSMVVKEPRKLKQLTESESELLTAILPYYNAQAAEESLLLSPALKEALRLKQLAAYQSDLSSAILKYYNSQAAEENLASMVKEPLEPKRVGDLNKVLPLAAALGCYKQLIETILKRYGFYIAPQTLEKTLTAAAAQGNSVLFRILLDRIQSHFKPKFVATATENAFFWAALNGRRNIINFILQRALLIQGATTGRHITFLLKTRSQLDLSESAQKSLTDIRKILITFARLREALGQQAAKKDLLSSLADLITKLPAEVLTIILDFVLQPFSENSSNAIKASHSEQKKMGPMRCWF